MIFGGSHRPTIRHEVPLGLADPIAYVEHGGVRHVFAGALEVPAVRDLGGFEVISLEELGLDGFLAEGMTLAAGTQEALARGCERVGLREAIVPRDFPLEMAEFLRARGISLRAEGELFDDRRRAKSPQELAGIQRAQRAGEAAMAAVCDRLRTGEPVDADELRGLAWGVFAGHGAGPHDMLIVACGPQGFRPHREGEGPITAHEPIIIDIFPQDLESGCWGDLTRTVCLGDAPERLRRYHEQVLEATRLATEAVRPGASGGELNRIAAQHLKAQGHPTRLDLPAGQMLEEGFVHAVGHGVGLEVHEAPLLDKGGETLVVGDVVTIEPGVYYEDFGGVRIEDLVRVTESGHELITDCPYDLELSS